MFTIGQSLSFSTTLNLSFSQYYFCTHQFKISLSLSSNFYKKISTCSLLLTLVMLLHPLYYQLNPNTGWKIYQQDMVSIIQVFFTVLPLGFAWSGSNNARSVAYTTRMMIVYVINGTVCFNFFKCSGSITTSMASYGARLD